MYVTDRAVIFHTPKCGGMTVRHALLEAGLMRDWNRRHLSPGEVDPPPRSFRIALIRHPLRWYRSLWAYMVRYQGPKDARHSWWARTINEGLWPRFDPELNRFLEAVLEAYPGLVGTVFERFTEGVDRVVPCENLLPALCDALEAAGDQLPRERLLQARWRNRSPSSRKIDRRLAEQIMETEAAWLDRSGDDFLPDDVVEGK